MCMPVNSFSPSLVTNLMEQASMSPIGFKLSAVMLKNKKPIGPVLYNSDRMYSRGKVCSSLHAEANVLLNHFSSALKYTGGKWRLLRKRSKKCKI
jgi:hypothetical protein